MNADGTNQTRLTNSATRQQQPSWSPDSAKIAFMSRPEGGGQWDIYVIDADGSNETQITFDPYDDFHPVWSPDGSKFAFTSSRRGECLAVGSCNREIFLMNADGSNQTNLSNGHDSGSAWSPDGTKIAFHSQRDGNNQIYVMNADGSGQTRLTNNSAQEFFPDWGP